MCLNGVIKVKPCLEIHFGGRWDERTNCNMLPSYFGFLSTIVDFWNNIQLLVILNHQRDKIHINK